MDYYRALFITVLAALLPTATAHKTFSAEAMSIPQFPFAVDVSKK